MERIQYTEEQEKKLIEMVQFLYPEYKEININGAWMYFDKGLIPLDTIPIFEFCITHLADKILVRVLTDEQRIEFYYLIAPYINPIDYLYKEFKKLK